MTGRRAGLAALAALALMAIAERASAQAVLMGRLRGVGPAPSCDDPLGPSSAELYAQVVVPGGDGPMEWHVNGTTSFGLVAWDETTGAFHLPPNYGGPANPEPTDRVRVIATHYPPDMDPGEHPGFLAMDVGTMATKQMGATPIAPIPAPTVDWGVNLEENRLSWPPLAPTGEAGGSCDAPAVAEGDDLDGISWNVYRLDTLRFPPADSTAEDYLLWGYVGTVANDPQPPDMMVHFRDIVPSFTSPFTYSYVIQPVLPGGTFTGDADEDGIADEDVDGDGVPEFVSPDRRGRGLTARVATASGFRKLMLISRDAVPPPMPPDRDGDGAWDGADNCLDVFNPWQEDRDADARGDACDRCPDDRLDDVDGDLRCANTDNCPFVANSDQTDSDGDGLGDACDPDTPIVLRLAGDRLSWSPSGAAGYNAHRGTIPQLGLGQRGAGLAAYDHECFEPLDAFGDGALVSRDPQLPSEAGARGFYYLVGGILGGVQQSLGQATHDIDDATPGVQTERPVPHPCP